jgi:aspartyl protease family protein
MNSLKRNLQFTAIWIGAGLLAYWAFQRFEKHPERTQFQATGDVVNIARGPDGHYHWPGSINGQAVEFLIDTGATTTALPLSLAQKLKLQTVGETQSSTAGGMVTGQVMRANVALQGGVQVSSLRVVALPELGQHPLLGMDVLGKLRWQQNSGVLSFDLRTPPIEKNP